MLAERLPIQVMTAGRAAWLWWSPEPFIDRATKSVNSNYQHLLSINYNYYNNKIWKQFIATSYCKMYHLFDEYLWFHIRLKNCKINWKYSKHLVKYMLMVKKYILLIININKINIFLINLY